MPERQSRVANFSRGFCGEGAVIGCRTSRDYCVGEKVKREKEEGAEAI
jgi:hypothetical protein